MPQETNLNVSPYFDDFDKGKNYHKVLFKPGYPIQSRELTSLQSILQNQIEQFGNHFFKEGAKVIPGQLTYIGNFYAVELNDTFSGIPLSLYLNNLIGLTIYGKTSGVKAKIVKVLPPNESERGTTTIYVNYIESSSNDFSRKEFLDNEVLSSESSITFGNTFINSDEGFASTINKNSTSVGSAFALSSGVYFLRGTFVEVNEEILILDQYTNKPSYRVGLLVNEEIITSDQDTTLVDNAQGYSNYSAPGADRLKISASLFKKDFNDFDNTNFVQLASVENGVVRDVSEISSGYNIIGDELARRTYDESGHYYVKSFVTHCKESLNDGILNNGIFNEGDLTYGGKVPNEDLAVYKISPGKAYVKGYETEIVSPTFLDCPKPRTSNTIESQGVNFQLTPTLLVNNVTGSPLIGINTSSVISLRDKRIGSNAGIATGKEIGIARVYDFKLEQGGYDVANLKTNRWDLSLFDIQTYSEITLNEPVTLTIPTRITGKSTGSTGFLKSAVSGASTITVYQISGNFSEKENIIFDDSSENQSSRYITDIRNYGISDVKSVYSNTTNSGVFVADTLQKSKNIIGISSITANVGGISTVITNGTNISGIVDVGTLIQYSQPGLSTVSYARVEEVSFVSRQFKISPVTDVDGVVYGSLPTRNIDVSDIVTLTTNTPIAESNANVSDKNALFSVLPKQNISSVDLSNSQLTIRKQYIGINITNGSTDPISVAEPNSVFLPFDEERYILIRSNGSLEILTSDKFEFQNGSTTLVINGLGSNDTGAILIATLRKNKIKSKSKKKKVVESIIINKSSNPSSGSVVSTLNDGLLYGNYPYGTRVQDREICLNYPDVNILYGIFESTDNSDPDFPSATVSSMDGKSGTTNDLLIGETVVGKLSGAKASYFERKSDSSIGFIYQGSTTFIPGEVVSFKDSKVNGVIGSINQNSRNIIENYDLLSGQTPTYYDYSRIIRKSESTEPQRKLKIVFSRGYYETSDDGDITTVNSYDSFDYKLDIKKISNYRLTDVIDFRPRVSDYVVSVDSPSPFEFNGRKFDGSVHSSKNVITSDDPLILTYSYYLPRIDRIFLSKDKNISVVFGTPSDNPTLPEEISGSMNIANVYLPAYLYNSSDARIEFVEHKRYQMRDIHSLEKRIKNLEYYTTLSVLETDTKNLFIDDGTNTGSNRFKSGFFIDNFTSILTQNLNNGIKNSIDNKGQLRPSHFSTIITLEHASTSSQSTDKRYSDIVGSNIKKSGNSITLDYTNATWLRQPFATRTENVTPFFVKLWEGSLQLYPTADVWISTNLLELRNIQMEGSFAGVSGALRAEIKTNEDGERIGVSPTIWGSWEVAGIDLNTRQEVNSSSSESTSTGLRQGTAAEFNSFVGAVPERGLPSTFRVEEQNTSVTTVTTTNTFLDLTLNQQRTGQINTVREKIDTESLGDRIVRRDVISFMRSRNIEFTSKRMKPFTQVYPFFDGVNVSDYCFSKLVEIRMTSGVFNVGETVVGEFIPNTNQNSDLINFRLATPNHKYGPYNNPSDTFDRNPYDRDNLLPDTYSSTSTILNIDTYSLTDESSGKFFGNLKTGMKLRGKDSLAEAVVTDVKLITDRVGTLIGSFRIPSGLSGTPRFETGRSRFRLTSSSTNSQIPGVVTTSAEETFYSQGDIDTRQETTLSLKNASVEIDTSPRETRSLDDSTLIDSQTSVSTQVVDSRLTGVYQDPLAQSFSVDDPTGIYATKVDVYFRTKAEVLPITLEIREVGFGGVPNNKTLAFSKVELTPDKIKVSEDASEATTFEFESPVYLEGRKEYAIVLISNSNDYNVWISRLGESDVQTLSTERNQILVTTQPLLGSLYKSQNASVWTPSEYEDLTFTLYRADFVPSGFIQLFNSDLPENLEIMTKNPLSIESNRVKISLSSTVTNTDLSLGNTIIQNPAGFSTATTGKLVGFAGSAYGQLGIINSGIGYTGSNYKFDNVQLRSITGSGINATANIIINNGGVVAAGATIVSGGTGYVIGDVLEPISIGTDNLGSGMRLSVSSISGKNELLIDNIQGEFTTVGTDYVKFINNSGITTDFSNNGTQLSIGRIETMNDGLHFKVFHRNHGMHSSSNIVRIRDISSDVEKVTLTAQYPSQSGDQTTINLSSTTNFNKFENVLVGPSNPGYIKIVEEILSYTGVSGNTLTGVTRQIDSTKGINYPVETSVEKYELGGVSLRRINKTHQLSSVSTSIPERIGADYYYLKVDMSAEGTDRSTNTGLGKLRFNKKADVGGASGKASYNVPFEAFLPNIKQITPPNTFVKSAVRTVSGTSLGGSEVSFVDMGFKDVSNNEINYFDSPMVVASTINEGASLNDVPNNKSINLNMYMATSDSRVSPMVDLSDMNFVLISNRVNQPITDYKGDFRVNTEKDDPNLFTYTTKQITLESSATAIKVIVDAYLHNDADIRALYSVGENNSEFTLFPGSLNINPDNQSIISLIDSDGTPDTKFIKQDRFMHVPSPSDFNEYQFTANLDTEFKHFRIKLIGTSRNQAFVPMIRNLRVIALD